MVRTCLHGLEKDGPCDAETVCMVTLLSAYLGKQKRGTHGLEVLAERLGNSIMCCYTLQGRGRNKLRNDWLYILEREKENETKISEDKRAIHFKWHKNKQSKLS